MNCIYPGALDQDSLVTQAVKNPPAISPAGETQVQSESPADPPEKEMTTHSSILACEIPWAEEPGGLQSLGSQRVRQDWATNTTTALPLCWHKSLGNKGNWEMKWPRQSYNDINWGPAFIFACTITISWANKFSWFLQFSLNFHGKHTGYLYTLLWNVLFSSQS